MIPIAPEAARSQIRALAAGGALGPGLRTRRGPDRKYGINYDSRRRLPVGSSTVDASPDHGFSIAGSGMPLDAGREQLLAAIITENDILFPTNYI